MMSAGSLEWEEARGEFFQESYPTSDRSISESNAPLPSNQSTARRASSNGHGGTSNRSSRNPPSDLIRHPPLSLKNASTGTLESRSSRISRQSGALQRTPPTASTTPADAISPSGESPTNEVTTSNGVPLSQVFGQSRQNSIQFGQSRHNSIQSLGHAGRATKPRMRAAVQGLEEEDSDDGEIEVVDFNDENLATEVESWDNQKKLRDMAISLSQKKSMRSQYEKCPKIKLTKLMAFRFAVRRCGFGCCNCMAAICRMVRGWCRPLIAVDRHRGCEMFACLNLQKVMMLLCAMLSLSLLSFLILPYLIFTCNFSLDLCQQPIQEEDATNTETINNITNTAIISNLEVQIGTTPIIATNPNSWLNATSYWWWSALYLSHKRGADEEDLKLIPFYYGFFENRETRYNSDFLLHFFGQHLPFIYLVVIIISHLGVLFFFYRQLIGLIKGVIAEEANETWFKGVFASWNYNVVCKTSSLLKHRSVYRHIKQKIQLSRSLAQAKTFCTRCLIVAARCLSLLFTLVMWSSIVVAVHFATRTQMEPLEELPFLQSHPKKWQQIFEISAFSLPVVLVALTKIIVLPICVLLEKWECFPFSMKVIIYSTRLFVSRAVALFTLVTTIFHLRNTRRDLYGQCWEDHLCNQLLALTILDLVIDCVLIVFLRFPRVLLASVFKREWSCSTKLNYDPYESVIDLVIDLGLISCGMFYCPLLPLVICSKLFLGYGLKMFHIWVNCSASGDIHSPNTIRFLFVGFSSVMVLFSTVMLIFALVWNLVSDNCGPFVNLKHAIDIVKIEWNQWTGSQHHKMDSFNDRLNATAIIAYILSSLIAVLLFGLYISHLKRLSIERSANELKCQLAIATQEKCYLISKIKKPKSRSSSNEQTI